MVSPLNVRERMHRIALMKDLAVQKHPRMSFVMKIRTVLIWDIASLIVVILLPLVIHVMTGMIVVVMHLIAMRRLSNVQKIQKDLGAPWIQIVVRIIIVLTVREARFVIQRQ